MCSSFMTPMDMHVLVLILTFFLLCDVLSARNKPNDSEADQTFSLLNLSHAILAAENVKSINEMKENLAICSFH